MKPGEYRTGPEDTYQNSSNEMLRVAVANDYLYHCSARNIYRTPWCSQPSERLYCRSTITLCSHCYDHSFAVHARARHSILFKLINALMTRHHNDQLKSEFFVGYG